MGIPIIAVLFAALLALPLVAQAQHPEGNPGDLSNSCQVSAAQGSYNGLPVRSKVESTCPGGACGMRSTVPAGTKGCAYRFVDVGDGQVLVFVSMPVIGPSGVTTYDRYYFSDQLTGAN